MFKFKKLKTSEKISTYFVFFNFFSLIFILLFVNIIYHFFWKKEIEIRDFENINSAYINYEISKSEYDYNKMMKIVLKSDAIIKKNWNFEYTDGILEKFRNDKAEIQKALESLFYVKNDVIYMFFSKEYEGIWKIILLHDSDTYWMTQCWILKACLILIIVFVIINYIIWRYFSRKTMQWLKYILDKAKKFDLDLDFEEIKLSWPSDDEIRVLAKTINTSFEKIKYQTEIQKQFINDVSHEFKTPLMIMNSKIDLYNKSIEKWINVDNKEFALSLKKHIKRLNKIIEILFYLSRIEWKDIKFDLAEINLKEYLTSITSELKNVFVWKKVNFILDIDDTEVLKVDKTSFSILTENIFTNAIKFSDTDVEIKVTYKNNTLEIQDNWNWIKKEQLWIVWWNFIRLDKKVPWFWVWLFLVKRIIKIYWWTIELQSKQWVWTKFIINIK